MIDAIMAHNMEVLWNMTELVWLLQRYVLACVAHCLLSCNFKMCISFSNNRSFRISVYLRLV